MTLVAYLRPEGPVGDDRGNGCHRRCLGHVLSCYVVTASGTISYWSILYSAMEFFGASSPLYSLLFFRSNIAIHRDVFLP